MPDFSLDAKYRQEEGTVFLRAEFDKWKQVIADGKIKEN